MEFDFNKNKKEAKEVVTPTVNTDELGKSTDVKPVEAPIDTPELTGNVSDKAENKAETEAKAPNGEKVVLMYLGGGVYRDKEGKCWSRDEKPNANILSTRAYAVDEYEAREDLKFMVQYGEMKKSLV